MVDPVEAWRVHDTGLVTVPGRFRRLGGLVRHLQGHGEAWPESVTLSLVDGELRVAAGETLVGSWSPDEVTIVRVAPGPPVTFVLELPEATHLLAAAATPTTDALLVALEA